VPPHLDGLDATNTLAGNPEEALVAHPPEDDEIVFGAIIPPLFQI